MADAHWRDLSLVSKALPLQAPSMPFRAGSHCSEDHTREEALVLCYQGWDLWWWCWSFVCWPAPWTSSVNPALAVCLGRQWSVGDNIWLDYWHNLMGIASNPSEFFTFMVFNFSIIFIQMFLSCNMWNIDVLETIIRLLSCFHLQKLQRLQLLHEWEV